MEKGLNCCIKEKFGLPQVDIATYSPLALAYIGDGIYDLIIRSIVVGRGNTKASKLHMTTSQLVKAHAQSEMMRVIEAVLSPEEEEIFHRGRNAKSPTMAKNATMTDYRRATGFEALMGYLYLLDRTERIFELVELGIGSYDEKTGKIRQSETDNDYGKSGE
ncbi:MAG: Mini-ribonuclease 3 [Roseburia sp.]